MVLCAKVRKKEAERYIKAFEREGILDGNYRIERDAEFVYLPLRLKPEVANNIDLEIVEREGVLLPFKPKSYVDLLSNSMPPNIVSQLPRSFDVLGDIVVIKLPDALRAHAIHIGNAILEANRSICTVLLDEGVCGEYRVRKLTHIAGVKKTTTIHKEFGMSFELDLSKVYFSPRLANERQRVCEEIRSPCVVIDMFAGVGPFSIAIAKKHSKARIYAVDINPGAYFFLVRNIERNHVHNVFPVCGDASKEILQFPDADYIIMNLPHSSEKFIFSALKKLKYGGKIFLYLICEHEKLETKINELKARISNGGRVCRNLIYREVHTYSPLSSLYAFVLEC
ncbi:MAG: class I SAM-dependent methyltransferase [Thermoplasmata archaeon]